MWSSPIWVFTGNAAAASWSAFILTRPLGAVLLDLGLPKRDGLQVLRRLRRPGKASPVIVITDRDGVDDRMSSEIH